MTLKPNHRIHSLYCPLKSRKSAVFIVVCFSVVSFASWKGLDKPLESPNFIELLFAAVVVVALASWLVAFSCFRERLVLSLAIASILTGQITRLAPSVFSRHAETVKTAKLSLWLLALFVSLTMLTQSVRRSNVDPRKVETSTPFQPKQNLQVFLVLILSVLVLGALLYLVPFRH